MSVLHMACLGKEVKSFRYFLETSSSPEMSCWQHCRPLSSVQAAAGLKALLCALAGADQSRTRGLQEEALPRGERVMWVPDRTSPLTCDQLGIPFLLTGPPDLPAAISQG